MSDDYVPDHAFSGAGFIGIGCEHCGRQRQVHTRAVVLAGDLLVERMEVEKLRTALNDAIEMLQWSTGAWGNTSEEDLKKARPVLHAAIARYRAVVSS